jgi:hypothetical protein
VTAKSTEASTDAPIANQPASIQDKPAKNGADKAASSNVSLQSPNSTLFVKIRIPECCVRDFALTQPAVPDAESTLEQQFQAMQTQIRWELQPILATANARWKQHCIDVAMIHPPASSSSVAEIASEAPDGAIAFSMYAPTVGLGIVAVTILVIIWGPTRILARIRREPAESSPSNVDRSSSPSRMKTEPVPEETRLKLKQMVDDDPDQAAEIIKQWIRDAA